MYLNLYNIFFCQSKDCGLVYVEDVTFEGFNVVWTCPCSDWSSVDKYNLNLVASDGEIDYTHVSRTDGKCPNFTQNTLIKRGLQI